ncbi:MAG: alpha/beta hydrolase [Proteobacteria bacterium]|nr:alpha/beta hydrolase [Pseudomonadota bacterium]
MSVPTVSLHGVFTAGLSSVLVAACTAATAPSAKPAAPAQPGADAARAVPAASAAPAVERSAEPAGAESTAVVIGQRKVIRSARLGEERAYLVYTPRSYEHGKAGYPVMYLLDGDAHFHHTTGLVSYLANLQRMPEMIVVAIGNTDRTRDLTPTRQERFPTSGGADNFLAFIKDELIPAVDRDYRTVPHRVLVGHSFGGLFTVHALTRSPDTFQGYVSISPSLWWQDQLMRRNAEALIARRPDLDAFLHITLGNEREHMRASNQAFAEMLENRAPAGLRWKFTVLGNEDHGSVPHRSIYLALEALYAEWTPGEEVDSLAALEAHFAGLSKQFGYSIVVPERVLNVFGYRLLGADRSDDAIAAFKRNIELYPESANVYDSLGEAYEKSGQIELAKSHYAIAVDKASKSSHPYLSVYKLNLDRARKLVAAGK